jgi:hypothetical protein
VLRAQPRTHRFSTCAGLRQHEQLQICSRRAHTCCTDL